MKNLQYNDQWWINSFSTFNVVFTQLLWPKYLTRITLRRRNYFDLQYQRSQSTDDWTIPLLRDQGEAAHHTERAWFRETGPLTAARESQGKEPWGSCTFQSGPSVTHLLQPHPSYVQVSVSPFKPGWTE